MKKMLLAIVKKSLKRLFLNRYFFIILFIALISVFAYLKFFRDSSDYELEIYIPDVNLNKAEIDLKEGIEDFLQASPGEDSIIQEKVIETEPEEPIETKNSQEFNDYLIDIYKKIEEQDKKISELEQQVLTLEQKDYNYKSQASDNLSIILIELYKIKELALLNAEYSRKIAPLIKLSEGHIPLNESLIKLQKVGKLVSKDQIISNLKISLKDKKSTELKEKYQKDKNILTALKANLNNYIEIRKDSSDNKENQILTSLQNNNFNEAYNIAKDLFPGGEEEKLIFEIRQYMDFENYFLDSVKYILGS